MRLKGSQGDPGFKYRGNLRAARFTTTQKAGSPRHDSRDTQLIAWLLEEHQPSVRYLTLAHLLDRREDDPEVREAHSKIPRIGWARDILRLQKPKGFWEPHEPTNVREWMKFLRVPEYVATTWRALVLSDLGLTSRDPRIRKIADRFFEYKLQLGTMINIFTEEVCAVGNAARLLTRFGYGDDYRVKKLYDWLLEDQREDGGWNCSQGTPGTLDGWERSEEHTSELQSHSDLVCRLLLE